jgi:uncharacterized protein YydD (DUF2326 family)
MKLSQVYSDKTEQFETVVFNPGLNVILAEIRDPANREKDTHNLGKTTLSRLIDFLLLKEKNKDFFLFKHSDRFDLFVFFLEVDLENGQFLTIRRAVENASKISFKYHSQSGENYSELTESEWDHWGVAFEKAKEILDGALDLEAIKPFGYRQALAYALRSQGDYNDVFQLDKFRGKHADWKPYLAKTLGFDVEKVMENYALAAELEDLETNSAQLRLEVNSSNLNPDKLGGILLVKKKEVEDIEGQLEQYNFQLADAGISEELVNQIESEISDLNERRYYLQMSRKRIQDSLRDRIIFDPAKAQELFKEAGVLFAGQIKSSFDELTKFNTSIAVERNSYLKEELQQISTDFANVETELKALNAKRAAALSTLRDRETFTKYRKLSNQLIELRTSVEVLNRQKEALDRLQTIDKQVASKKARREELKQLLSENIQEGNDVYKEIRLVFNSVIKNSIDREAVLSTKVNEQGNLEFSAEILNEKGLETSEAMGHTYRMLLCIAFDMAVAQAYLKKKFLHFLYHDGIFESLDDRKKLNLIDQLRSFSSAGLQHIVTLIDSDLPLTEAGTKFAFQQSEIILLLHDEGDAGRLFKMPVW